MIRVMIVEDEPPILRDIISLIESTNPEFVVVACACNGCDAISMLENDAPDVIFTDIQMPVVDGLELINHIREKELDIIPVILSGYNEFAYAKKAITLSVADYLLKPLNAEELEKLLVEIAYKVKQKRSAFEREYISNLVQNGGVLTDLGNMKLERPYYLLMLICAGSFPTYTIDYYSLRRDFWRTCNIESIAAQFLKNGDGVWVFDGKTGAEKVAVFTLNECTLEAADSLASSIAQKLNYSSFAVTMVVSPFINKVEEIGSFLQSGRVLLNKSSVIGLSQIIKQYRPIENAKKETNEIPIVDSTLNDRLALYVRQGNIIPFKTDIQRIFKQWEQLKYPQVWVEKLLREIISLCQRSLPGYSKYNSTDLELETNEAISISNNYSELFGNIWYIFEELFDVRSQNTSDNDSIAVLIHKIDKYINANITEPINNQLLSDIFGLVPSYLSKLFREYKGMSPPDYLLHLRVERARELIIAQPDIFLKDIAALVGYQDPLYFSKIFKKETGMSPSEYRNSVKESKLLPTM